MAAVSKGEPSQRNSAPGSFAEPLYSWRYLFLCLSALLLLVLFYAEENWRGKRAWAWYQQKLIARGERMNPSDFVPARVADEGNFAATPVLASLIGPGLGPPPLVRSKLLGHAQSLALEYDAALRVNLSKPASRANTWAGPPARPDVWRAVLLKATNQTVLPRDRLMATNFTVPEAAAAVLAALSDCEPVLAELQAAGERPHARFDIFYEKPDPASIVLPHLSMLKQLSQLVGLRASAELALGRREAAFADVQLMLYLADATRSEPILVSQLVRAEQFHLAMQGVANGMSEWSEPQLVALQQTLRRFNFCADGNRTLRGECFYFGNRIIENVRRSTNKLDLLSGFEGSRDGVPDGLERAGALMNVTPEGWFDFEHLNYSRMFEDYLLPTIDATNLLIRPGATRRAECAVAPLLEHSATSLFVRHRFFCGLMLRGVARAAQKIALAQTAADTAAMACALERYRRRHGQFPDALPHLVPEFIPHLPHDIINGQPLTYRCAEDVGYVLYSVGWNETDDGGRVELTKSGGMVDGQHGDWVWQPCH